MKCFKINQKGTLKSAEITKKDLTSKDINIRDLRPIFSKLQVATILPRSKFLIINFGFIKAVLSQKEAIFLNPNDNEKIQLLTQGLSEQIKTKQHNNFYLYIFEKILEHKAKQMSQKVNIIKQNANSLLKKIKKNFSEENLETLLTIKKRVSKLEARLSQIESAAREVLDEEENFNELVAVGTNKKNDLETESIIENFLEQTEETIGHIFRLKEEIDDTQEFIDLKLSSRRTSLVLFDLIATIITLVLSFLAVVVGLYGTNIKNGLENSSSAFLILTIVMIIFFITSVSTIICYMKKNRFFS